MPRPAVNLGSNRPLLWLRPGIESWATSRSLSDRGGFDHENAFRPPAEDSVRASWYGTELDSEHIWDRGFGVSLSDDLFHLDDPDIDEPPPLIVRAAWGHAVRSHRRAFPFDFEPSVLTGTQYCALGAVWMPTSFLEVSKREQGLSARGAWVGWDDRTPEFTDTLEVVFAPNGIDELPSRVPVAQILFDLRRTEMDPFVVAATRVLEPLMGDLRRVIGESTDRLDSMAHDLRTEVDRLEGALRTPPARQSHMRKIVAGALTAISTIILGIIANHLDVLIHWDALWRWTRDAGRCLGLW